MRNIRIFFSVASILLGLAVHADGFSEFFQDKTLRLDYTFSGNNREQRIYLDEMKVSDGWYGRRVNMDSLLLQGNGQITVTDTLGVKVLYRHSFSLSRIFSWCLCL